VLHGNAGYLERLNQKYNGINKVIDEDESLLLFCPVKFLYEVKLFEPSRVDNILK